VRPRQRRFAALRPVVCALIATPFLIIAVVKPHVVTAGAAVIPVLVFVAFFREAQRNARGDPLVIRGRVIQCGGLWDTDSGGMVDAPAQRVAYVWRVTIEVREACFVDDAGQRRPAPEHVGRCEIDQPWWVKQVELGEEVALVCLPGSTDPLLKLDVTALDGAALDRAERAT
jgi:hypothetical protein